METEYLLLFIHHPLTSPYVEPDQSRPRPLPYLSKINFNSILSSMRRVSKYSLAFRAFYQSPERISLLRALILLFSPNLQTFFPQNSLSSVFATKFLRVFLIYRTSAACLIDVFWSLSVIMSYLYLHIKRKLHLTDTSVCLLMVLSISLTLLYVYWWCYPSHWHFCMFIDGAIHLTDTSVCLLMLLSISLTLLYI
jgi:hypothetical protein